LEIQNSHFIFDLSKQQNVKRLLQRALPLKEIYTITGYNYIPLIDGEGTCCDNCGKLIANMVYLKDSKNKTHTVGNDCAKTLTFASADLFKLETEINNAFNEGKTLRTKIVSHLKKENITGAYAWENTKYEKYIVFMVKRGGTSMQRLYYPEISLRYVEDLLTHDPNKIK